MAPPVINAVSSIVRTTPVFIIPVSSPRAPQCPARIVMIHYAKIYMINFTIARYIIYMEKYCTMLKQCTILYYMRPHLPHILVCILVVVFSINTITAAGIKSRKGKDGTIQFYSGHSPSVPGKTTRFSNNRYDHLIKEIAGREGVDPQLVRCIVSAESGFNANAVSVAGAMGLMQLMQEIVHYYDVDDPFDPRQNLDAGIRHFAHLLKYFKDDVPLALAAYHAGLGRVKKNWSVPPIKSTIHYVKKVMKLYRPGSTGTYDSSVKKLYRRISSDGTIHIYSHQ